MMKYVPLITSLLVLAGCAAHSPAEVKQLNGLELVNCAEDAKRPALVQELTAETSKLCSGEVKARLASGEMTQDQYTQFLIHVSEMDRAYSRQIADGFSKSSW